MVKGVWGDVEIFGDWEKFLWTGRRSSSAGSLLAQGLDGCLPIPLLGDQAIARAIAAQAIVAHAIIRYCLRVQGKSRVSGRVRYSLSK